MKREPFILDLDKIFKEKAPRIYNKTPRFFINYLKRKIHIDQLNEILTINADKEGVDFMEGMIDYFGITINTYGLDNVSKSGRYIFASNHPLGGLDGVCLSVIVGKIFDKKIKYVVNDLLFFIKNLQPIFLPINKHGAQSKEKAEIINKAYASDNQIITFPAGICSRKINGEICDLEWKKNFIQKAIESKREVVPVYFEARNSNFFYRFANIRKRLGIKFNLEMFFLPDEMFKNKKGNFSITFGKPIPYSFFDNSKSAQQWSQYVKEETYKLSKIGK